MTPAEEDALIERAIDECSTTLDVDWRGAIRLAIRAAYAQGKTDERKDRRCSITGNQCLTDTWASDRPHDCHCGRMFAQHLADTRAAVAQERERCAKLCDDLELDYYVTDVVRDAIRKGE